MKPLWIASISPPTVAAVMQTDVGDACNSLICWLKARVVTRRRSLCRVLSEYGTAITTEPRSEGTRRLPRSYISTLLDWLADIGRSSETGPSSGSHPMRAESRCISQREF
jgi:hypothetical protein